MWLVHDLASLRGAVDGSKTVCGGLTNVGGESRGLPTGLVLPGEVDFNELWYSMMPNMLPGCLLEVMIVVTPVSVAISAAMSLVSIPPVPRLEPKVLVLTDGASELHVDVMKYVMYLVYG